MSSKLDDDKLDDEELSEFYDELTSEEVYLLQTIDFAHLPYCFCRRKPDLDISILNNAVKRMMDRGFIYHIIERYNGTPTHKLTEIGMALVKLMKGSDYG